MTAIRQNRQRRCSTCSKRFRTRSQNTTRCNDCKAKSVFFSSSFGLWFVKNLIRHKYLDAITGIDISTLYDVWLSRKQFSCYSFDGENWNVINKLDICHLYPANPSGGYTGQFSANNLFIAPSSINRSLGNKVFNVGVKVKTLIPLADSMAELRKQISESIDLVAFVSKHKPKTRKTQLAKSFDCRVEYSLSDIVRSECARLDIKVNRLCSCMEIFKNVLTGDIRIDTGFITFKRKAEFEPAGSWDSPFGECPICDDQPCTCLF